MVNFEEYYKSLVGKLGFSEDEVFRRDYDRGRVIVSGKIDRKLVLLKVISKQDRAKLDQTKKDLLANTIIEQTNEDNTLVSVKKPKIITSSEDETALWIVREFVVGKHDSTIIMRMNYVERIFSYALQANE